ncbi:MAG: hypothetical protein QOJ85_2160 [Solirubrobacteraceae bacterium]|nr:hypothetical protein [Solirubrobacteraceae bacterium]
MQSLSMLSARRRSFATTVVGALSLAGLMGALVCPAGASASPGVPDAPTVLFGEDFENNPAQAVVGVTSYTGAAPLNETYATDPQWAPDPVSCNGLITAYVDPWYCVSGTANANVRLMARKLGTFAGDATPDDNHVVSAYTDQGRDPGANHIELETVKPVTLPGSGSRFLVFSADVADVTCGPQRPSPNSALFAFFLLTGSTEIPLASAPTDVCSAGGDLGSNVIGGRITSEGSILFSGSQLGVRLRNALASGNGNDHAFDNIRVSDASPQLDKAFGAASVTRGDATSLTFTVTNTSDLVAKNGWSFTDKLPAGLQLADPSGSSTNCPAGVVTAAPGGQSIKVTGNLDAGQTSCTVTVNVIGAATGTASNGAAELTTVGLRKPAKPSTVTVAEPTTGGSVTPACSDGKDNDADGKIDRADSGCNLNGHYLPRKNSEASIAPLAQCARGDLRLTDVYGRGKRTVLRGVAGPQSVGAKVALYSSAGKRVATATVQGDLSFSTTAALPAKAIRNTNAARFQARLGGRRSSRLKFARRMTGTVARRLDATRVLIGGRVTGPLAKPVATVLVRASSSCPTATFRGTVVARGIRVQPNGRWTATITLPPSLRGTRVFLRAETRVRKSTRSPKRFRTFTLVQGVALR